MNEHQSIVHSRNKLILILYTCSVILGIVAVTGPSRMTLSIIGIPIAVVCGILVWKKWFVDFLKYVMATGVFVVITVLVMSSGGNSSSGLC